MGAASINSRGPAEIRDPQAQILLSTHLVEPKEDVYSVVGIYNVAVQRPGE